MLLENKHAIVYGGAGALGGAVARAFAREGGTVHLAGRTAATLDAVARDISASGGKADTAQVDALDEGAVERHAEAVAAKAGRIDVSFNLISIPHIQGTPLLELSVDDVAGPVTSFMRTHFLTARAAARRMVAQKSGVILMMTTTPARLAFPLVGPFGASCSAIEGLSHTLAAELGPAGVRVVCLLSSGSPESAGVKDVTERHSRAAGQTPDQWVETYRQRALLRRLTTLAEVANLAVFMASDRASAVTGTAVNLTCGALVD
jgi:3-oxoacyl-[acyl-carrier protein] reductase